MATHVATTRTITTITARQKQYTLAVIIIGLFLLMVHVSLNRESGVMSGGGSGGEENNDENITSYHYTDSMRRERRIVFITGAAGFIGTCNSFVLH
jgi:hypothetical protein